MGEGLQESSVWRGEASRDGCRSQTQVKARQRQGEAWRKARRIDRDGASKSNKPRIEERWRGDERMRRREDAARRAEVEEAEAAHEAG